MRIQYHQPYGSPENQQDILPENWQELVAKADSLPIKFGMVNPQKLFRSGIIWPHQVRILQGQYNIAHIISLIPGDWLSQFYDDTSITIHQFPFYQRRELTFQRVRGIVDVINSLKEAAIVHCVKGVTKTGMVSAGYQILNRQRSNLGAIVESMSYGILNPSSIREILQYSR